MRYSLIDVTLFVSFVLGGIIMLTWGVDAFYAGALDPTSIGHLEIVGVLFCLGSLAFFVAAARLSELMKRSADESEEV